MLKNIFLNALKEACKGFHRASSRRNNIKLEKRGELSIFLCRNVWEQVLLRNLYVVDGGVHLKECNVKNGK